MKNAVLLSCLVAVCGVVAVRSASGDTITGLSSATSYQGTSAALAELSISQLVTDSHPDATQSYVAAGDTTYGGSVTVVPYHVSLVESADSGTISATGKYLDEVYFATAGGQPGYLAFDFDAVYGLGVEATTGSMTTLAMQVSYQNELLASYQDGLQAGDSASGFAGAVTLSTVQYGHALASGFYYPLDFSLWAESTNGAALVNFGLQPHTWDLQGYLSALRVYSWMPVAGSTALVFRQLDSSE